jgi:DNA-binding winged helix-turn-helix (wHTH) protein
MPVPVSRTIEFDGWTLHLDLGELERAGQRVRLQDQPFQVLHELLSRPGELVTREQLIARLWPKGVVDFDLGLNSVVRKLRVALQDEADTPRYIQTVPRKGYRFIGTVERSASVAPELPPLVVPPGQPERNRTYLHVAGAIVAADFSRPRNSSPAR